MGWFLNDSKDKREERLDVNKSTTEWQKDLECRGFEEDDRAKEMNKNYKAHIGQTAKQIEKERNTSNARDSFTAEELTREAKLERKQSENIKDTFSFQETKGKLEETRKDKKSWW